MGSKLSKLNCTGDQSKESRRARKNKPKKKKVGDEAEKQLLSLDELRSKSSKLTPTLSKPDQDLVEDQIRGLEKKISDIQTVSEKKRRAYEELGTDLDGITTEIEQYADWLRQRDEQLSGDVQLGHSVEDVENSIEQHRTLCEDLRGRQAVLDGVTQKLNNWTSDLSKQEQHHVEEMIRRVHNDHHHVTQKAEERTRWLDHCLAARENLHTDLDKTQQWLQDKEKAARKLNIAKLHSSDIEKQIEKSKNLLKEIHMYEPAVMQLEARCGEIKASSDDVSITYLRETLLGITTRYESLKSSMQTHIDKLKDLVGSRKLLETDMMKVELWCREAQVKISGELKLDNSLEVLDDQHRQHMTLANEASVFESLIADIGSRGEVFLPNLDSTDKLSFQNQLKSMREKQFQISSSVGERRQALESSLTTRTEISRSIQEAEAWLTTAQEDIKRMNRPVGHSVEDARHTLQDCQTLQEKLVSYRPSVAELSQSVETLRSSGHVTEAEDILRIISQHEMLMDQSEQYANRSKQALVVRQQFTEQQGQVETTLQDCQDQVNEIRQSGLPVSTKLSRYKVILTQLQTLEPQVDVLGDKALQIGVEGNKGDNQALNAQVESLRYTLSELRSSIDDESGQCERAQLQREDFEADIEQAVVWMEERCDTLVMKTPLDLDTDRVDLALQKHKVLSEELLATLDDIKSKAESEKTRFEEGGEPLPQSLTEKLSELNNIELKIKSAIEEKEQYLMGAMADRLQFETSLRQVTEWLHGGEELLEVGQTGLDYDTIHQHLHEHKEYFMEGSLCQDEMEQVMELSERLLPTLDRNDQETLQQSLTNINQRVDSVVRAAQQRQDHLEAKTTEWREYDLASQKVCDMLEHLEEHWASLSATVVRGPDDTNLQLKQSQEFLALLEQHRAAVDDLNEKTRDLDRYASTGSHNSISQTVGSVNDRWNDLISQVENKQVSLQDLDKDFELYKETVSSLQRHLSEVNLQVPDTRTEGMNGQDLSNCLEHVKSQSDKLDMIQPQIAMLKKQAQSLQRKLPGAEAKVHVQERMMELIEHYERVNERAKDAHQTVLEEIDDRETFQTEVEQTVTWLRETQAQLTNLRPGKDTAEMQEKLEKQKLMEQEIAIRMEQMRRLSVSQEAKYTSHGTELPHEMRQHLIIMETLQTEVGGAMKEKEEELLHLREDREEFEKLHRLVSTWLEEGALQLSEPIRDVDDSIQKHEELLGELDAFKDKLASLKEVGKEIHQHTSDPAEKEAIQKAFSNISRHWSKLQRQANNKTEELRKASEAKRQVDEKLADIKSWAKKTERLLDTNLTVTSYQDVKQKLDGHKISAKEGEQLQVKLQELSSSVKELNKLCDASTVMESLGDLTQRIFLVQTQLADRLHLLEEANTEVQCYERDVAELSHWMDQTRAHLMVKDAGVPLKEQLTFQDQLVEDIERQKLRSRAVLDHPPECLDLSRVNPVDGAKITMQLEHLLQHATEQSEQVRDAVQQQEQYNADVRQLTVAIEDAQRQLKESPVVVANVDVLKQQMSEHTVLAERIKLYQAKINELNQKSKDLSRQLFPGSSGVRQLESASLSRESLDAGLPSSGFYSSQGSSLRSLVQAGLDMSDSGFPLSLNTTSNTHQLTMSAPDTSRSDRSGSSASTLLGGATLSRQSIPADVTPLDLRSLTPTSMISQSDDVLDSASDRMLRVYSQITHPGALERFDMASASYKTVPNVDNAPSIVVTGSNRSPRGRQRFTGFTMRTASLDQPDYASPFTNSKQTNRKPYTPPQMRSLSPSSKTVYAQNIKPDWLSSLRAPSFQHDHMIHIPALLQGQPDSTTISVSEPNLLTISGRGPATLTSPRRWSLSTKRSSLIGQELSRETKLTELNLSWNTLQRHLGAKEKELQAALEKQEKYQESVKQVTAKLEQVRSRLSSPLPVNNEQLSLQMEQYKETLQDLHTARVDIAHVRERGRQIMEVSDPEGFKAMQATMTMLNDRVKGLETAAEDRGKQLHNSVKNREKHDVALEAYRKRVNDLEGWLTQARLQHAGTAIPCETSDTLGSQLEENKNLQNELNSRLQQLSDLAVQCDSLCEMESPVKADKLRRELADIQNSLGDFKLEAMENQSRLKAAIKESEKRQKEMDEYEGNVKKLQQWITDTRRLTMAPVSAEVTAQISAEQEQLHKLETELSEHRQLLRSLSSSGLKVKEYRPTTTEGQEGRELLSVSEVEIQLKWEALSKDLEHKKLSTIEAMQKESLSSLRHHVAESSSLLLGPPTDPTVAKLADIHRILRDLNDCWRHLQTEIKDKELRLEQALDFQQRFQDALLSISAWLDGVEHKLLSPDHEKSTEQKLKETENVLKEIKALQQELLTINKVSQQLIGAGVGDKVICQSIRDLTERVRSLESRAYRREAEIARTQTRWQDFRTETQAFRTQLNEMRNEFDDLKSSPSLQDRLSRNQKLEIQLGRCERTLESLRQKGLTLCTVNPRMSLTAELTTLHSSIQELRRRVHDNREDLRKFVAIQEQYGKIVQDYSEFLDTAQDKLKTEIISAKDLDHLKQQCSAHKEFFGDLDEHRGMVEMLALQCDRETKEKYQPQQHGLNSLTQVVQDKASLHGQRLDRLVRQWTDLDGKVLTLQVFIADVQRDLPSTVSDADSLQTIQQKLGTYQRLHNALNNQKPLVHEVVEKGKQILHSVNCPRLETTITDLADKFVELHSNVSVELKRTETLGDQWQTFEAESAVLKSWLMAANVQLSALKQLTDKDLQSIGAIRSKVDRILEFRKEVDSHLPLKSKVTSVGQQLVKSKKYDTANLDDRLTSFEEQWGQLLHDIDKAEAYLHQAQMDLMPSRQALQELAIWLDGIEKALREDKDRSVKSLGDIEAMLKKYKGYKIDMGSKQLTVDFVNQTVLQSSQESIGQPGEKTEFAEKLGQLNKRWQMVGSDVTDRLKNLESLHAQWEEYEKAVRQLQDWFHSQEDRVKKYQLIGSEVSVRQTLRDCKALQDALRSKEDEIESTRRLGMSLAQMSKDSPGTVRGITDAVESVSAQWAGLSGQVTELQSVLEDVLGQWAEYHSELNTLNHVLNETDYTLTRYTSVSPHVHTLKVQAAKLQSLQSWFEKHLPQQETFARLSGQLMQVCDAPVRQDLQQTLTDLKLRWNNLTAELRLRCEKFDTCLQQWQRYRDEHDIVSDQIKAREQQYNDLVLMRDNSNQQQQCFDQSKMLQLEMDNFSSQLNALEQLGEEFTENLDTPLSGPISSQQAILGQRLAHLKQALNKHTQAVEDDLSDHKQFQELLDEMSNFLKQSEKVLGQRDPDKTSDNNLVKQRSDQLKELSSQFADNQSQLDSLNDLGYRMALSESYSEKLLQLNHRWQRMQGDTADRYRKMQSVLLLQQDFSQKCENWISFLQQTEADLTKDMAGNYPDLLEQQKKCEMFQAEVYSRQQILQSIIADGQKMLREGEVTDRPEFQHKLTMLADQWQNVIKQSNHHKTIIDKSILQWQTFKALLDRLNSWLRNKEHDLQAYDFENASLQNVRYLLEKARATLQEFTTQDENYTKVHEVGKELLQRADPQAEHEIRDSLTSMQQQWHKIFGRFDGQRERLEGILKHWQLCEEELEDILAWLRELRKVLSTELPNSYDELQKDLHQCKDIETSFDNSEDRRQMLLAKERQLNTSVEATDLSVLKERIRLLSKQWDELRNQASLRRHRIFDKLHEWSGFNEKYRDMCDWTEQMEIKISSRTEYHVEDLLTKLQKDYRFEMDTREKTKAELVRHGRELMSASSEVRASDIDQKIARLEDKWQHLKSVIAYRQHKLQETLLAVQQLEISMANLRKWLGDMEHELGTPVIYHECDIKEIQRKVQHQQELQKDIEKHSPGIASVLNLCEVLLRDADACPTEVEYAALQHASRTLDKRWRNICQLAADRRLKIDETWRMWQRFRDEHKKFTDWLRDVQLQVRDPRTGHSDVTIIKADIQHFETIQRKVRENLSQLETINKQYRKMAREGCTDNAGTLKDMMQDANDQWDRLSQRVTDAIRRLKQPSGIKEDFETTLTIMLTWWTEISTKLTELESNTEMDVYTKIIEMKKIETEIEKYRKRLEYLNETALYLIQKGEPSEVVGVQDQLDDFHRRQRDVLQKVHTYQVQLQKISAGQMKTIAKPGQESEQTTKSDLEISEAFGQREKHKTSWHTTTTTTRREDTMDWTMEEVEKYLESSPPDSPPEKRRATARVSPRSGSWRRTTGEITETSSRLSREERRRRLREEVEQRGQLARVDSLIERLVESLEEAAEKIVMTEQELRSRTPTGPDSDYAPIDYTGMVRDCEVSIDAVHKYERQLKREAGVSSMPSVDAQVNSVVERWEMLQVKASEKDVRLKQHRTDWAQFKVDLNSILTWLDESEAFLENESYSSDDVTLLESVVRRHKDFLFQLESKKKVVMSLNLIGKNFVYNKSDDSRHIREQLRQMNKRWEAATSQANLLQHRLEIGLAHSEEFHHMIHDLLLWLESVENKLQQIEPVTLSAEDIILRTQYRRLTELKADMEQHQPEVVTLKETADQLLMTTDSPDMALARDKTRIIANRLKSLMRRLLTYVSQLENVLGLSPSPRSWSSSYDYTDSRYSRDSGIGMAAAPSPRLRTLDSTSATYRTRPRSALAYTRQLLFGEPRELEGQPLDGETTNTTLAEGSTDLAVVHPRRRPALLARVIRAALPLQVLMLLLLGIACLVPVCEDDEYGCIFMNNLERSWTPMLRYTDGAPPT